MDTLRISIAEIDSLMQVSKSGDTQAFNKLTCLVRNISYCYFLSKLHQKKIKNSVDVDDLTNDVCLSFIEQYQNIEKSENWLRKVLFITYIKYYKKSKKRIYHELNVNLRADDESNTVEDNMDLNYLIGKLKKINPEKQKIIHMRFWEDMKFAEIARQLHKKESAVKKMLYRSLSLVKNNYV
jgi:RNA polymerase sigma-70 factor (ECF subfamily)